MPEGILTPERRAISTPMVPTPDALASSGLSPVTVTLEHARIMSGLSISTLYRLIGRGELDTVTIGRRRLVKVESINRLVGVA